jgi:phospholipid/cholesterol/gamma-HCH transport system substrate-binding protein
MDERILRFRVGVVVVAAALITMFLITLLGAWPNPFTPRNTLHILFPAAPGVTIDTPVRKSGIEIGRVSAMELKETGEVLLTLKIDSRFPLRYNEECRIATGSLVTGDAVLEFVPAPKATSKELIPDGSYLTNGRVESDPFEIIADLQGQLQPALRSIETAGNEVGKLANTMNTLLGSNDDQLGGIVKKTDLALDNFNKAMISIDSLIGDEKLRTNLRESIDKLPEMLDQARNTLADMQSTLQKFSLVAVRAEKNLANVEDFTAPLGQKGEAIVQNIVDSTASINELLANFAELSHSLKNKEGTVGQLINNPELYERLNRTLAEIELVVRKLEPIVNDVRVITDKVARDPGGEIGLRSILDRRPPGAGQKFAVPQEDLPPPRLNLGELPSRAPMK